MIHRLVDAGRNQRSVCRLGFDTFAAQLHSQLEPIPRGGLGRWPGLESFRPPSPQAEAADVDEAFFPTGSERTLHLSGAHVTPLQK